MKTTSLIFLLGLFTALAAPAARSQAEPNSQTPRQVYTLEELELRNYEPNYFNSQELWRTLESLHGRQLDIVDGRRVSNLMLLGTSLVIYETPERMKTILDSLRQLDGFQEESDTPTDVTRLSADEVGMRFYNPSRMRGNELYSLAWELKGREILVDGRLTKNLVSLSDGILIYDTPVRSEAIFETLAAIENREADESEAGLETFQYRPSKVSLNSIQGVLQPYQRMVVDYSGGVQTQSQNIVRVDESGVLVIRDTPERIAEIRGLLEQLDVAPPQVLLTCYVIQGLEQLADGDVPSDLASNLRQLLPYPGYRMASMGIVRSSAAAGHRIRIEMDGETIQQPHAGAGAPQIRLRYNLELFIGAFDPANGSLSLDRCEFNVFDPRQGNRTLFSTTMSISGSDYSVLGVAGGEPLFVVLRATPVE